MGFGALFAMGFSSILSNILSSQAASSERRKQRKAQDKATNKALSELDTSLSSALAGFDKQKAFYQSLIDDPFVASDELKNYQMDLEKSTGGEIDALKNMFRRTGRSDSGQVAQLEGEIRGQSSSKLAEALGLTVNKGRKGLADIDSMIANLKGQAGRDKASILGGGIATGDYSIGSGAEPDLSGLGMALAFSQRKKDQDAKDLPTSSLFDSNDFLLEYDKLTGLPTGGL